MKLHLPKALFTAVMALFAVSQTVWGGEWIDNTYSILNEETITELSTAEHAHSTDGAFIRAGGDAVTATITELNHIAGQKLTISGTWGNATGTQGGQGYDLANLTISTLNIKDGDGAYGAATLEIGTSMQETGDAVPEMQHVTIGIIKGTVSSLNVGKHGTLTLNALRYNNNPSQANSFANSFADEARVTVDGVLDLTGIAGLDSDAAENDKLVAKLMNAATGTGTIKLKSGSQIQTAGNQDDVTLSTNYVVEGGAESSLVLTSWKKSSGWRTWNVSTGGSLTVGDGAGKLNIRAGQQLKIDGGSVTVGELYLGHKDAGNAGKILMENAASKLTVSTILGLCGKIDSGLNNEVVITAGTLKVTGSNALGVTTQDLFESGTSSSPKLTATIGGSGENSVTLQTGNNDVTFKGDSTTLGGGTLTIGNITIDEANTQMITISDAVLCGIITNNATAEGAGLTLSGAFTIEGNFITANQEGNTQTGFSSVIKLTGLGTSEHTFLADGITFDGISIGEDGWQLGEDGYYYRTLSTSNVYHVYNGTTNVNDIGAIAGDTFIGYEVHSGATLDMNGQDTERLTIYLQDNATLANSGSDINDQHQQLKEVTLKGNAKVNAGGQFGVVASGYGQGKLDLAGYTLTKTGDDIFLLTNTEITAGTLDITQGTVKIVDKQHSGAGTTSFDEQLQVKVAQGATLNIAGDKTSELVANFILSATGTGDITTNHANVTVGSGTSAFGGKVIVETGALTLNGTVLATLEVTGGTLNANANSTITKAYLKGAGKMQITDATLKNLRVEDNGTVNITGSATSIGVAGETYDGRAAGLYAKAGEVNIGDGSASSTVTVTRLEFGDNNSTENVSGGTLNVKQNATLIVTGNNNAEDYKNASILFGEWEKGSTLNVHGNFYAKNAKAMVGDTSFTINIKNGGVAAIQGVCIATQKSTKSQLTNLNLEEGAKLILGADGIDCNRKGFTGVMDAGTVGISADSVTIAENIALSSSSGTTFDTTKYSWNAAGNDISQAEDATGGTLIISGAISDHSVTTGEGDAATTTTTKGKLIVTGKGMVRISSSNNTYSGGTEVKGGATLEVAGETTNALGSGVVDVKEKSTLKLGWWSSLAVDTINLSGESIIDLDNASSHSSLNTLSADINIEGNNTIKAGKSGNNAAIGGTIKGNGTLNLDNKGNFDNTWLLQSTISDKSDTEKLAISSNSNAVVSGTNTYTGGTTITGRTLTTASEKALGEGKVTVEGGTLKQDGSALQVTELEYKSGTVNNNGQALEVGTLTVGSTNKLEMQGSGTTTVTDKLTVSKTEAFSMEGALVLTDATVDLSGFTLDTTTPQDTYVYTLGTAAGGITAGESITFSGLNVDGYTAVLAAMAADPSTSSVMLLDGTATNNYLVLTLTKIDDTPTLTTLNVTGVEVEKSSNSVLTLTTAENAADAVFGESLNAVMKLAKWKEIKAALADAGITLDEQIAITFVGADGATFDFDGADDTLTPPTTITINGEGTRDGNFVATAPTLSGDGTIVGNYVTAYIPEPTTTTLSLLALAALAARRRRR